LTAHDAPCASRWPTRHGLPRGAAVILLALVLSACVNVDFGSTFVVDGSAGHRLVITFQRDLLEPAEVTRLTNEIARVDERMTSDGYEVQRIDSATQLGLRAARSSSDAGNAAAELNSLINSMLNRSDSSPIAPFQGTFTRSNPAVGGNKYHLELTFDGQTLRAAIESILPASRQPQSPSALPDAVTITYTATMPGRIRDSTGQKIGDDSARWTLSLDEPTSITADSTVGKDTPWALAALAILFAVGVIVVSSVMITTILVIRRQSIERRLPMALRISRERAAELGITVVAPPSQWSEIRAAIGRSVQIALGVRRPMPPILPTIDHSSTPQEEYDGTDSEGN